MNRTLINGLGGFIVVVVLMVKSGPGFRVQAATPTPAFTPQPANLQRTRDVTLADLGHDSDDTVHGVRVTRDYGVNWPDAWAVRPGNTFTLRFSHSPVLDPRSSMTVEFNGTRLSSVLLTSGNTAGGRLQVVLPENSIRAGYNRLRLEFYMGVNDFNCRDLDDPAVWATVRNTSAFHLSYTLNTLKVPNLDLAAFPAPFIDNSSLVENHVTFILPEQPTPAELNAAVAVSAKLGQLAAWRTVQLHTASEAQARAPETVEGDLIVVGRADRLQILRALAPPFVSWKDDRPVLMNSMGEPLPPESGVLWERLSPIDETAVMLVVTGATDEAVLTAGRALASEVSYPRLADQLGIVLNVPPPPTVRAPGQVITLEELGYNDRTGWGTREQSIGYTVPLPLAWQIRSEATLDLHFAHSETIDPKRASLNVLLNGTPVGSLRLTPENAVDGHTTFRLPAQLFQSGNNALVVMSDMNPEADHREQLDCLHSDPREAWLVVYADSQLNLPGGPRGVALNLADYPPAFVGPANLSDLAFIVPHPADGTIAHAIIQIAGRLGRFAEGKTLAPRVIDAQTLDSMDRPPGHQILIGRPTQNAAIARLNDVLPQPFKSGTDDPEAVETLVQVMPPEGTAGYIQAVLSAEGQPRLVVTGSSDEGVLWAGEVLGDPELVKKLDGDLAIVGAKGSIATAEVRPEKARQPSQPSIAGPPAPAPSRPTDWIKWLAAGLFALTLAILAAMAWPEASRRWRMRERRGT